MLSIAKCVEDEDRNLFMYLLLLEEWLSRTGQIYARNFTCAPDRTRQKNGRAKPKCSFDRKTTTNIAFCSRLPKQDLQLSYLMYFHR